MNVFRLTLESFLCGCYWIVVFVPCLLLHFRVVSSYAQLTSNQSQIQQYLEEQSRIVDRLLEGYDKRFIPAITGKPLKIELEIVVSDVLNLDDNTMESEMLLYIRQIWYDYRLSWNSSQRIKVREHLLDKIWLPDTRISNLKDIKRFDGFGGINMNIHANGRVYFSQLALVKISCPMELHDFPMDKQTCFLNFSSYAYRKSLMFFSLAKKKVVVKPVYLPQFEFVEAKKIQRQSQSDISQAEIVLTFKRRLGYYILQIYVPSVFLVILSWLAFLMEPSNIADRLAMEVTMILSIVFLLGSINTSLPHVSYTKASDWFIIVSFWFVFLALLETMLVYRMTALTTRSEKRCSHLTSFKKCWPNLSSAFKMEKMGQNDQEQNTQSKDESATSPMVNRTIPFGIESSDQKPQSLEFWVDKICIIAFPGLYIVFNIFYWGYYL